MRRAAIPCGSGDGSGSPSSQATRRPHLSQIETPVEIIGGLWDWAVPPSNLDLVDAGHFTWEDAADQYAEPVTGWWTGGAARA